MSLHRRLRVLTPCSLEYDEMRAEGPQRRFCETCEKSVHELKTVADAERALSEVQRSRTSICVRYAVDAEGAPALSRRRPRPTAVQPSRSRSSSWLGAPLLALGLALSSSACVQPGGQVPSRILEDRCVYDGLIYEFDLARGEGSCPGIEPDVDEVEIPREQVTVPLAPVAERSDAQSDLLKLLEAEKDDTFTVSTVTMGVLLPEDGDASAWGSAFDDVE